MWNSILHASWAAQQSVGPCYTILNTQSSSSSISGSNKHTAIPALQCAQPESSESWRVHAVLVTDYQLFVMLCMIDVAKVPELTIGRASRHQRQYTVRWRPENVLMIALACLWVVTILRVGRDLDLSPRLPAFHAASEQFLDGPVALLGVLQSPRTIMKPAAYYQQLHQRPVAASSSGSVAYPQVRWPLYDGTLYAPPTGDELGNGTYANNSNPYMVIAYNGSFFNQQWPTHQLNCSVPCVMTSDVENMGQRADVLVFHAVELDWQRFWQTKKPLHQLWALHSMESEQAFTVQQADSPVMNRIDIQATYKLSPLRPSIRHVPVPYINRGDYSDFTLKRPQMLSKAGFGLWMHNNCEAVSSRQVLVSRLMELLPIDSPGDCLHNIDIPAAATAPVELMASYKFYFVFENVFGDPDWVSSTFFRALDAGTVPVVLGAPNILKFAPGPRSIIRACDFDSMEQLAAYLHYLDRNDTAYREYLTWKETGPSPEFQSLLATSDITPWCRMCIAAAQTKMHAYDHHYQGVLAWHYKMKLAFDILNAQLDVDRTEQCRGNSPWWQVKLTDEEYAKLWANAVADVAVPEEFGGDLYKPNWQLHAVLTAAASGTTAVINA